MLNVVLLALYVLEVAIKITATVPNVSIYFLDLANVFDLLVVVASLVDVALSAGGGKSGLQVLRVIRMIRVFRTLVCMYAYMSLYLRTHTHTMCTCAGAAGVTGDPGVPHAHVYVCIYVYLSIYTQI